MLLTRGWQTMTRRSNLASHPALYRPYLRIVFTCVFMAGGKKKSKEYFVICKCHMIFTCELINKTLDTATPIYLHNAYGSFRHTTVEWTSAYIPLMAHKLNLL